MSWDYRPAELRAREIVGAACPQPPPRPQTMAWPGGQRPQGLALDRCYEFVRECGSKRITGRRLEALTVLWGCLRELALAPQSAVKAGDDVEIGGVSVNAMLTWLLPGACGSPHASSGRPPLVDTYMVVDTCLALATRPPKQPLEVAARLHALWFKIHCAMADCAVLTEADYLMVGRVAAVLNPSLGGLAASYLPEAGIDEIIRDRVDVLVANIAHIGFTMLKGDEAVRVLVMRYLMGNAVSGVTDRGRAEVTRYGNALEDALAKPSYEHNDHVSRGTYDHSVARVMGDWGDRTDISAEIARWGQVTRDAVNRLPVEFTKDQASSNNIVIFAVRDAVMAVQSQPAWGREPSHGIGIPFSISISHIGCTVEKVWALAEQFAYYVGIEKARDAVKGDWGGVEPLPEPPPATRDILTAGWPEPVKAEYSRVHAQTQRIRSGTFCRNHEAGAITNGPATFSQGPNYQAFMWDRAFDGFWPQGEMHGTGELGGPLHILEQPGFWIDAEIGICAFEVYNGHRRKWEDKGGGVLAHLVGPMAGRATWVFDRTMDLRRSQATSYETDTVRPSGCTVDATFWYWSLSFPGTPTWNNLTGQT
ncbi:hypothetical protein ABZT04_10875 [Streptomyces sp. NPDC005492]|uniref:hypothetical protein n=1 Tax=Streptomyces sp. NPDC005492 TaxID=3156883 RepID=UPI0033B40F91